VSESDAMKYPVGARWALRSGVVGACQAVPHAGARVRRYAEPRLGAGDHRFTIG